MMTDHDYLVLIAVAITPYVLAGIAAAWFFYWADSPDKPPRKRY